MAPFVRPSFERHVVLWLQTFLQVLSRTRTEGWWTALQVWSEWLQVGLLSLPQSKRVSFGPHPAGREVTARHLPWDNSWVKFTFPDPCLDPHPIVIGSLTPGWFRDPLRFGMCQNVGRIGFVKLKSSLKFNRHSHPP